LVPPTATDDCMGTITAITTNPLFHDIPGEYWVIWTYIDNYENESMQSQLLILASGEDFMEDASLQACQSEIIEYNLTLIEPIVTDVSNVSFSYFETFEDMSNNNPIANPENYININNLTHVYIKGYVEGGCSDFSQIELSTIPIPTANSLSPIICDDNSDGVSEIVLNQYISQINSDSDASISFYEDQDLTTLINPEINYTVGEGDIIYVKVLTGNCQNES